MRWIVGSKSNWCGGKGRNPSRLRVNRDGGGDAAAVDSFQLSAFRKTREIIAGTAGGKSKPHTQNPRMGHPKPTLRIDSGPPVLQNLAFENILSYSDILRS